MIETDLNKITKISEEKEDENWEFRSFLKFCNIPTKKLDKIVNNLYKEVSRKIDCTACGNCCKKISPLLNIKEIRKLSKTLGIAFEQFEEEYLLKGEGGFHFNVKPCHFLRDNLCLYYECRPEDCRSYPHLHKDDFISRLIGVIENYSICPIVFNVYERLKEEIWHR